MVTKFTFLLLYFLAILIGMAYVGSYFTYIVQCVDGTFYVGMTRDIATRLKQHNGIKSGGAKYTRQRRPVILRYYEKYDTFLQAAQRERKLKKLTHQQKEKLYPKNEEIIKAV